MMDLKRKIVFVSFLLLLLLKNECFATSISSKDGNELFKTLSDTVYKKKCIDCHNISTIDTFNFNPSIHELAQSIKNKSFDDIKSCINESYLFSNAMSNAHHYSLSDDTMKVLIAYINTYENRSEPQSFRIYSGIVWIIGGVLLLVVLSLVYYKFKLKTTFIVFAIVLIIIGISKFVATLNYQKNYSPKQVLKFSHKVHATENQINCLYCHHSATKSAKAGIPSMSVCFNCHTVVREGQRSGAFELNKLFSKNDSGKNIAWVRATSMPEHVKFSHKTHLKNEKVTCTDCHTKTEDMHQFTQTETFSMKWCMKCHTEKEVGGERFVREISKNNFTSKNDTFQHKNTSKTDCIQCHH